MKRYLYLISIVLVIVIVILAGVLIARQNQPGGPGAPITGGTTTPGGLPVAPPAGGAGTGGGTPVSGNAGVTTNYEGQKFSVVASDNKAIDFFANPDGSVVFIQPDGQIMKVLRGKVSSLSSSPIANLIRAEFSYDGRGLLTVFGNGAQPEASVFDVTARTWRPLPANTLSPTWSPDNHQLAYLGERNGSGEIFIVDATAVNATPQEVMKIEAQDIALNWLGHDKILLSDKGSALFGGSVWALSIKNKTLTPLVMNNPGLDSIWNDSSGLIFTANQTQEGGSLGLVDAVGNSLQTMSFLTLPSKCAFSIETLPTSTKARAAATTTKATSPTATVFKKLYCAVPRNIEQFKSETLPDSYFRKEFFTADDFYAINLADGTVTAVLPDAARSVDATNLKIFNNTLFFVNRFDDKLYAISLK